VEKKFYDLQKFPDWPWGT